MKSMVLGSKGLLGSELMRQLGHGDVNPVIGISHEELDITDSDALTQCIAEHAPDVIWNCVAYNAVDKAEADPTNAFLLNEKVPSMLAELCKQQHLTLVQFSTGYVFDGTSLEGYSEDAIPNPQTAYGKSKYAGEQAIQQILPEHYIIRLNWLFGAAGTSSNSKQSFPDTIMRLATAADAQPLRMVNDEIATPTYAVDLAQAAIALVKEHAPFGMYHITNSGKASWYDFAKETLQVNGLEVSIEQAPSSSLKRPATRPACAILLNTKRPQLRDWREALAAYYTTLV